MLKSPVGHRIPSAVPALSCSRRHRPSLAQRPEAAATAAAEASPPPAASGGCPFSGKGLFTRLTDTPPPRGDVAEGEQLSTTPRDYLPFKDKPWEGLSTGLTHIDPEHLFEIDEHYDHEIEEKRQMLRSKRDQTFRVAPEGEESCQELLEAMSAFLAKRFPDRFQLSGDAIHNRATGESFPLHGSDMHPLEAASYLVQEDLCLMKEDAKGALRLVAGAVAFPMRWSLLQKMGRRLHLVHGPVPFYNRDLRKPVDEFMANLTPEQPYERANWGVTDYPFLFQAFSEAEIVAAVKGNHTGSAPEPVSIANAADRLYLRCERQTLSRLEGKRDERGAALFTIRTYTRPLSELQGRPAVCARLAGALRNTDDAFINYKTMTGLKDVALQWLDAQLA